jgi:hypothetical protein
MKGERKDNKYIAMKKKEIDFRFGSASNKYHV